MLIFAQLLIIQRLDVPPIKILCLLLVVANIAYFFVASSNVVLESHSHIRTHCLMLNAYLTWKTHGSNADSCKVIWECTLDLAQRSIVCIYLRILMPNKGTAKKPAAKSSTKSRERKINKPTWLPSWGRQQNGFARTLLWLRRPERTWRSRTSFWMPTIPFQGFLGKRNAEQLRKWSNMQEAADQLQASPILGGEHKGGFFWFADTALVCRTQYVL